MAKRFAYLKGKAPVVRSGPSAAPPAEKLERVFMRRTTYRAALTALARSGRDDVGELLEELVQDWLRRQEEPR